MPEQDSESDSETGTDTRTGDLAPRPEPRIEPGEPEPGGADAIEDSGGRVIPDLKLEENPAVETKAPDDVREQVSGTEDTSTDATEASAEEAGDKDQGEAEKGKAE